MSFGFTVTVVCTGVLANYVVLSISTGMATACSPGLSSAATIENSNAIIFSTIEQGCTIVCSNNCISCAIHGVG